MDQQARTTEEIMQHWRVEAAEVPPGQRKKILKMMERGSTIGETREALDLPLMVVTQIVIEEFTRIEQAICGLLSGTKQS